MTGSYRVTADGLAGPAKAVRVFNIIVKSDSTATVVAVLNGTGGSEYDSITGTISTGLVRNYEGGLLLPNGCYLDVDAHTTYAVVNLEVIGA